MSDTEDCGTPADREHQCEVENCDDEANVTVSAVEEGSGKRVCFDHAVSEFDRIRSEEAR